MATISQTTFSNAFSWMEIYEFRLQFHWSLLLRDQLTIIQHWVRYWFGANQAPSHYLNQWWPILPTHICVARPQWVNNPTLPHLVGRHQIKTNQSHGHNVSFNPYLLYKPSMIWGDNISAHGVYKVPPWRMSLLIGCKSGQGPQLLHLSYRTWENN